MPFCYFGLWACLVPVSFVVDTWQRSFPCYRRELQEELGISLPKDAFELIFVVLQERFGYLHLDGVFIIFLAFHISKNFNMLWKWGLGTENVHILESWNLQISTFNLGKNLSPISLFVIMINDYAIPTAEDWNNAFGLKSYPEVLVLINFHGCLVIWSSRNHFLFCSVFSGGADLNNEFDDVYLITKLDPIPLESLTLQARIP